MDIENLLHYRIYDKIGEGPNGSVYKAWDSKQNRHVAIKILHLRENDPSYAQGLNLRLYNVKKLIGLDNPHIAAVTTIDEVDSKKFIVSEYVDGLTLQEYLLRVPDARLPFQEFAIQAAFGLKALHSLGVVHGNLKPSNIMIDKNGRLKLLDAALRNPADCEDVNDFEEMPPCYGYLSPEETAGHSSTSLSDLFSLGVLCYQYISGEMPFLGANKKGLIKSINEANPDFQKLRSGITRGVDILLVEKLLAKNPEERFAHAGELVITLQEMLSFNKEAAQLHPDRKYRNPRQYLMVSVLAILLIIFWLVITTKH